jgi:hypothetical protein
MYCQMTHEPTELPSGSSSKRHHTPSADSPPKDIQYQKDLKVFNLLNTEAVCQKMICAMYRYLAVAHHPDKAPPGKADEFTVKMQEINSAHERLMKRHKLD